MKRTPLPSHTWGPPDERGLRECEDCPTVWKAEYDDPPPWPCRRRSELKRSGGGLQQPGGSLQRSKGLSPVSDTNSGREHQKDEAYRAFCRRRPCDACGEKPPNDPAHDRSWGAGFGDWIEGEGNVLSLCRKHHSQQHQVGKETFEERYGIDMTERAKEAGRQYREQSSES